MKRLIILILMFSGNLRAMGMFRELATVFSKSLEWGLAIAPMLDVIPSQQPELSASDVYNMEVYGHECEVYRQMIKDFSIIPDSELEQLTLVPSNRFAANSINSIIFFDRDAVAKYIDTQSALEYAVIKGSTAHEIAHLKHYDTQRGRVAHVAITIGMLLASKYVAQRIFSQKFRKGIVCAILRIPRFYLCASAALPVAKLYASMYETQADAFSVDYLTDDELVHVIRKFEKYHTYAQKEVDSAMSNVLKQYYTIKYNPLIYRIWSAHPIHQERVDFFRNKQNERNR